MQRTDLLRVMERLMTHDLIIQIIQDMDAMPYHHLKRILVNWEVKTMAANQRHPSLN